MSRTVEAHSFNLLEYKLFIVMISMFIMISHSAQLCDDSLAAAVRSTGMPACFTVHLRRDHRNTQFLKPVRKGVMTHETCQHGCDMQSCAIALPLMHTCVHSAFITHTPPLAIHGRCRIETSTILLTPIHHLLAVRTCF